MRAVLSIAALLVVLAVTAIGARRLLAPATPPAAPGATAPSTDRSAPREQVERARRELDAAVQAAAERASAAD